MDVVANTVTELEAETTTSHRFTVGAYYAMGAAGILPEFTRTELIEGQVFDMAPIGPVHAAAVKRLNHGLQEALGRAVILGVQDPILLGEGSVPQPDVSVLRYRADFYEGSLPGPADVLVVIEVADTTAEFDRSVKARLYAGARIAEYWLVEPIASRLTVMRAPVAEGYNSVQELRAGDELDVPGTGVTVKVRDLLG